MERPVIGICAAVEPAHWGVWDLTAALLPIDYVEAVQRAGGLAVMIPPDPAFTGGRADVLDLLDGLLLAGGADIDPAAYGASAHAQTTHTVPERDDAEIALARLAIDRDLPVLGICRGMQLLNVARGGTLHQHLPELVGHEGHRPTPGSFAASEHDVRLQDGSLAAGVAGEALHLTKQHHHQGVDVVGEGFAVTGWSQIDDLPEAIELPEHRFVLGVQWHPEADPGSGVVAAFVRECAAVRAERDAA